MELARSEENVQGSPAPCCVFSRLRVASVIIGAVNSVVYLSLFSWYLIHNGSYSPTSLAPHRQDWLITCVDILVFTVFCVQVMTITTFLLK